MWKIKDYKIPFTWRDVSTYRSELFGASILSVILYHYFVLFNNTEASSKVLRIFAKLYNSAIGSTGVDIFIFLSGFGLYYSLSRGGKVSSFYRKRFFRVVFPYLICGLVYWGITDFIIFHQPFRKFLLDYSLLSFWISESSTFWYISFISLLYIIAPFVYRLTDDKCRLLIGIVFAFVFIPLCYFAANDVYANIEMALQRLPYFLIGMGAGKQSKSVGHDNEKGISVGLAGILVFAFIAKIIVGKTNFVFARSFYGYYGMFLIFAYVLVRKAAPSKCTSLFSFLSFLGTYSLEIYIVHTSVKNIVSRLGFSLRNPLIYFLHVVITVPLVFCLVQLTKNVGKKKSTLQ